MTAPVTEPATESEPEPATEAAVAAEAEPAAAPQADGAAAFGPNWKRNFLLVIVGQAISLVGSSAVQFSLIWWLASSTGSPTLMGLAGLVAFVPMTLLSPLAGILADRHSRKLICIASDMFVAAVAVAFAAILGVWELPSWIVLVILLLRGVGGTFQGPAFQALIPQLVPQEELLKAGGWMQTVNSASYIAGPVAGAALYAALPLPIVLLTDLVGAAFACTALALVKVAPVAAQPAAAAEAAGEPAAEPAAQSTATGPAGADPAAADPAAADPAAANPAPKKDSLREIKEGIAVYTQDKPLGLMLIVSSACMVFYLPLSMFYPLMTSDYFGLTAWHASVVEAAFAVGMIVPALLFGTVLKVRRHLLVAYIGLLGIGLTCLVAGLMPPTLVGWAVFAATCAAMGGFGNVNSIPTTVYLQTNVDPQKLGRAFSVMMLGSALTMPLGLLIASPIAEVLGVSTWFWISGVGMMAITLVGMFVGRRELAVPTGGAAGAADATDATDATSTAGAADAAKEDTGTKEDASGA